MYLGIVRNKYKIITVIILLANNNKLSKACC